MVGGTEIVVDHSERTPVFILNSVLLIPKVAVQPNLEEVQDVLNLAGKNITSVSKGVGQWMRGKPQVSSNHTIIDVLLVAFCNVNKCTWCLLCRNNDVNFSQIV